MQRGGGGGSGASVADRVLSQLLQEIDGPCVHYIIIIVCLALPMLVAAVFFGVLVFFIN